ncbi:MAG: hypothetical protein V1773_08425 [bacterium]
MQDNYKGLSLASCEEGSFGIYPINNGDVITKGDIFGIGEKTNWKMFKKIFKEKYISLFELEGKEDE